MEVEENSHRMAVKRLKNEIVEKNHELDVLGRKMEQGEEAHQV